jgi:glycosyltransferase involved in cell wall biosynthesis
MAPGRLLVSTRETRHVPTVNAASTKAGQKVVSMFHTQLDNLRKEFPEVIESLRSLSADLNDDFVRFVTVTESQSVGLLHEFPDMARHGLDVLGNTLPSKYFEVATPEAPTRPKPLDDCHSLDIREVGALVNVVVLTRMSSERREGLERVVDLARRCLERDVLVHIRVFGSVSEVDWFRYAARGYSKLTYDGSVADTLETIRGADLVFEPHSDHSFGMVVLEALVLKVPVVAWDSAGAAELLGRRSSLLCRDIDAAVDCIVKYESTIESSIDRSNFVRHKYSQSAVSSRFLDLIRRQNFES